MPFITQGSHTKNIRHKIVVVDDNLTALQLVRDALKPFYEVYPAPSGAKMFEVLGHVTIDLIILDIEMPEMDGYEVLGILKSNPNTASIPIVFLTSRADDATELVGFDIGAVDYVAKPFSEPLLLKRIANQLLIVELRNELLASQAALKECADKLAAAEK